ncbi:unnamed protein product [Linum tenue]|uniref:K Homology domain-containing protein n=1 Tax=Linum tenue TaxID=586396 RepID=A0AAV0LJI7_9ROSI|nr:unnamed protein product [Linum tenue]
MAEVGHDVGEQEIEHDAVPGLQLTGDQSAEHAVGSVGDTIGLDQVTDQGVDYIPVHVTDHSLDPNGDHDTDHGADSTIDHASDGEVVVEHEAEHSGDHNLNQVIDHNIDQETVEEPDRLQEDEEKQGHSEDATGAVAEKRWPGWPGESVFRMLVPAQKVGSIIGRKGEFIKKIVEETRARVKILDGPPGTAERAVSWLYNFVTCIFVSFNWAVGVNVSLHSSCPNLFKPFIAYCRVSLIWGEFGSSPLREHLIFFCITELVY